MRKKLFAIVMSMTMVASFMPSLAFATPEHEHTYVNDDADMTVVELKEALKGVNASSIDVVKPATCTENGLAILTCVEDDCDEVFANRTKEVTITAAHVTEEKVFSAEQLAAQLVKQYDKDDKNKAKTGWTQAQADAFLVAAPTANAGETYCKYVANYCSECNKVVSDVNMPTTIPNTGTVSGAAPIKAIDHLRDKTSVCNEYAKCLDCGELVLTSNHDSTKHVYSGKTVVVKEATCESPAKVKKVCKNCGEAYGPEVNDTSKPALGHNLGTAVSASEATTTVSGGTTTMNKGYFSVTGTNEYNDPTTEYYKYNASYVEKPAKPSRGMCTSEYRGVKCSTCGKFVKFNSGNTTTKAALSKSGSSFATDAAYAKDANSSYKITKTTHDYETVSVSDATCTDAATEQKVCKDCGFAQKATDVTGSKPLGHNYVVKEVKGDCAHANSVTISCSNKGCVAKAIVLKSVDDYTDTNHCKKTGDNWYFMGFKGELTTGIAIPTVKAGFGEHKFGALTKYKDATCTRAEVWAQKCTVCGKIDVSQSFTEKGAMLGHKFEKVVVAPTCKKPGYTVQQCSVCELYLPKTGTDAVKDIKDAKQTDVVKALTKDLEHTGEAWKVTKASTVFEEGVKTLVCPTCGDELDAKTVIAKKTVAKASNTVKAGKKSFNVKSTAANATGYRVYYKKAGAKSWKSYTKKTTSLSRTFSGLSKGKYYVKVRAYAKNYDGDGQVVWGATSSTKSVKVK